MAVRSKLPDVFIPTGQVGVGIKGGLEAAIHCLPSFIESHADDQDFCCLKLISQMLSMSVSESPFSDVYILNFRNYSHGLNGHITAMENFALGMTSLDHQGEFSKETLWVLSFFVSYPGAP